MLGSVLKVLSIPAALLAVSAGSLAADDGTDVFDVCEAGEGGAALHVRVENIRSIEGNLRAQVYSSDP